MPGRVAYVSAVNDEKEARRRDAHSSVPNRRRPLGDALQAEAPQIEALQASAWFAAELPADLAMNSYTRSH